MNKEIRNKISESQKGSKNSNWVPRLSVLLDSEEKKKTFSYLVGYWIGDGMKTIKGLNFSVRDNKRYIQNLVHKVSLIFNKSIRYRYGGKCNLHFYSEINLLKDRIVEEIQDRRVIKEYPWHFICGFLDSDGWVCYKDSDLKDISIGFCNTNISYLLLLSEILKDTYIPYTLRLKYKDGEHCKALWNLGINTYAGRYVVAMKTLSITVDNKKKTRFKSFIEYYERIHFDQTIPICETFIGVQGEGTNVGVIQYFIRAATCDMRCTICDSKYSWKKGKNASLRELVALSKKSGVKSICLTGGEIAQWRNKLSALVAFLRVNDFNIVLQTNGIHYYPSFDLIHTVAMDMKTPSTGEISDESLILKLKSKDEVKTLINDVKDYEYAIKINKITAGVGCKHILQPLNLVGKDTDMDLLDKYRWISKLVIKDKRWGDNIRVVPQMHVIIWGNKRGV